MTIVPIKDNVFGENNIKTTPILDYKFNFYDNDKVLSNSLLPKLFDGNATTGFIFGSNHKSEQYYLTWDKPLETHSKIKVNYSASYENLKINFIDKNLNIIGTSQDAPVKNKEVIVDIPKDAYGINIASSTPGNTRYHNLYEITFLE